MDDFDPHADHEPASDALHGRLRQAVDYIRSQPAPLDAQRRALDRVQQVHRPRMMMRQAWRWAVLAAACVAAPILLTMFMKAHDQPPSGRRLAVAPPGVNQRDNSRVAASHRELGDARAPQRNFGYSPAEGQAKAAPQPAKPSPQPQLLSKMGEDRAPAAGSPGGPAAAPVPARTAPMSRAMGRLATARPDQGEQQSRSFGAGTMGGGMKGGLAQRRGFGGGTAGMAGGMMGGPPQGRGLGGGMMGIGGGFSGGASATPGAMGGRRPEPEGKPAVQRMEEVRMMGRARGRALQDNLNRDKLAKQGGQRPGVNYYGLTGGLTRPPAVAGPLLRSGNGLPPSAASANATRSAGTPTDAKPGGVTVVPAPGLGGMVMSGKRDGASKPSQTPPFGGFANAPPDAGESKSKKKAADEKAPTVYREHAARPTFAHVYLGDGNALELVSLQVTTTIEGPRARTVVDHIFYNPHDRQLEGTFEYPLPAGASPSYFAMFLGNSRAAMPPRFGLALGRASLAQGALDRLPPAELAKHVNTADWGHLQEAHVVARAKALDIYEQVIRQRVDPALLEYSAGNTFSGRVFPIPAKGYNRVILAYEELLPCTSGTVFYNYPLPDCKLQELHYSLSVSATDTRQAKLSLKDAKREEGGGRVRYSKTWTKQGPGGSVQFAFVPPDPQVQVISGRQNESGPLYLYARIRPNLKVQDAKSYADHAVFLLDTSYSEHPDGFARNMKLLRAILEADSGIKHFNVLAFNIGATWLQPGGWFDNTPAGRAKAFGMLDGIVLEGATDLSVALDKLAHPGFDLPAGTPLDAFLLSDGDITWGDADVNTLVARFEGACPYRVRFNCYRTGLGADNLALFDALTRKGGGEFNCFTDNVKDVALAHRSQCLQLDRVSIVGLPGVTDVLVAGREAAIFPGGELIVSGRVGAPGHGTLVIEGTFLGQKFAQEYPVDVKANDELAPRGWGEVAVASLLALNDPTYNDLVTAYCQQFGIGSRVASFLVLENENDYKRLNLEAERGKLVKDGDLGRFLETSWETLGKAVSPREAFERFLTQMAPRVHLFDGPNAAHAKALLRTLTDKDYDLPASNAIEALVRRKDVLPDYLQARVAPGDNSDAFIAEAKRRLGLHDRGGAVRALSTIIEEFPGRSDALRLVGYRLLDLDQPAQAARLFEQVQRQRPFEPHSYLDLARSLEACGLYGLAAVQYEMVLAGDWDARFHSSLKTIAQEDYLLMMRQALRKKAVTGKLADVFGERLEHVAAVKTTSDLRVTISWNTDNTDVDLWVIEPDGTKCFYQNRQTPLGGVLSEDQTQGFGPERYQMVKAKPGIYTVYVHYFRINPNLLAGETHVNVVVTRHADTPQESVERHTIILKKGNEAVEVAKVKL